ncbi:hypothetical protein NliqN6_4247 [Naganishia liquefaciens]|uniref:SH3 domain-containing protein n=1 Tax=Naganishia liquefaciens TaxID=104408 RepID=A0A8H3TV67_9TREE|nr:hypothetical protein NliqN6_4247 [Naganishia liquefaciens]
MVGTINQDAILTLLCNQTLANINFLQTHSVIPQNTAVDNVKNELQAALSEINARSSFSNLSVSNGNPVNGNHVDQSSFSATPAHSSYAPSSSGNGESQTALVPTYGRNGGPHAPPALPGRPSSDLPQNRAVALWDYRSGNNDDLNFAVNDVIIIDEEVNSDWFKGHLESNSQKVGFFPSNYIQKNPGTVNQQPPHPRFVAPPSQQQNSFAPSNQNPSQQAYQAPYAPPPPNGYNPYQNQQYQNSHASLPPTHASHDQLALTPVPYTQGAMTTTVVTPGGNNAVVTDTETGKKNRFKLKPGGMGSTLAHSAVGGLGFGAGASVAGNIVNNIFN